MSATVEHAPQPRLADRIAHQTRIVRVLAAAEFKLKYTESVLGYLWTVIKPLAMFSILYLVFGHFFNLRNGLANYPIYLLVGIVLWTFFSDATLTTMVSLIVRGPLMRKMYFPRLIVPVSTTMTASLTLLINSLVIVAFLAWQGIVPHLGWLWILPLLLELYLFAFAISVFLALGFVRFRDMAPIWELGLQILFYSSPVIYPLTIVPYRGVRVAEILFPFGQIVEDVRSVLLYNDAPSILTASDILGPAGRVYPILIVLALLLVAVILFRREEPSLAERV